MRYEINLQTGETTEYQDDAPSFPVNQVPVQITMRQARVYLHRAGYLDAVNTTVNSTGGEAAITWEFSSTVERNNPLVTSIASILGWTDSQLDTMFVEASLL